MVEIKTSNSSSIHYLHTMLKHKQKQQKEDHKYDNKNEAKYINDYKKQTYYGKRQVCNKESFLNFNNKIFVNFTAILLILLLLYFLTQCQ